MDENALDISSELDRINSIPVITTILEVISGYTGMGFVAVARVTKKQWLACAVSDKINFGLLPGQQLALETTICKEIEIHHEQVVIEHVDNDPTYSKHHTPATYGFQSYISTPIFLTDGSFYGTLCAIDPNPAQLKSPKTIGMFTLFANLIATHLSAMNQLAITKTELLEEKETAVLREQFIAVLGHDLRNPVSAIGNSAQLLMRTLKDERSLRLATIIKDSTYRVTGLIDNVMDFARGRLSQGLNVDSKPIKDIEKVLQHVISELRLIYPGTTITTQFKLNEPVTGDSKRIAQLFSNLLGNAISHGDAGMPIHVSAQIDNREFILCVSNSGKDIPEEVIKKLFMPFTRGVAGRYKEGLGLGLYICSEIVKAHQGKIAVTSKDGATCFKVSFPIS
ncbi:GAF domain-containing sensor histidine kinase [Pedobacter sp. L105]|uniref:GAF domain-containing sensor histidine kinase n=1 Tax=Pedobacter sp. L105 TaxID=1641871 RepID=UPI0020B14FBD|nr:GAF domain-containing sensor histidine kinase [Pedobacter sp. L105]